jgi:tetratricopeptide (TPR) repeat protein
LGLLAKQQEKFTEAEDFYNQALAIDRETGDKVGEGFMLRQLGRLGEQIGNFDDAYGLFSRSLEVYQSINDQHKEPQLHINLGDVSAEYLNIKMSRKHYEKSIHIWKSKNDLPQLSVAYNRLADLYLKNHQFDEALEVTELSRKMDVETGDKRGVLINGYFTGEAWLGKKAYVEAKACFEKGYHDAMKNDYFLLQAMFAEGMVKTLRKEGLVIESKQWDKRSRLITQRQNLLKLTSENSRFTKKAIRMLKERHAPNLGKTSGQSGTFSEDSDSTNKSGVDSIGEMVFSGERKDKAYGSWVDEVRDVQKEELVSTSLALSLKQLLEKRASIHLDLSRMNFFASKDQIYDLLQPYIYSTNAHVRQPIHLVMLLEGDDPIEYHIIDGVNRFHILISALIGAFNKSHKDIPKSYSQILYQNNDQNGTVVDLLNNNEASWEDLNSFVSNVSLALETIIEEGHAVDDIIERISTGLIRATLFTAEKAH